MSEKQASPSLYKKMVQVMSKVKQLDKDGEVTDRNGKKMYNYLSEEAVTSALQRAFIEVGLVMFPIKVESEVLYLETEQYEKHSKVPITKVVTTFKIVDAETGEFETIQAIGYGSDTQDKGSNKAMTGAYKYAQRQTFAISTGDDGDHESSDQIQAKIDKQLAPKPPSQPQNGKGKQTDKQDNLRDELAKKSRRVTLEAKWKVLSGGSIDGFKEWYDGRIEKGQTEEQMETDLTAKVIEKEKKVAEERKVGAGK
jgi:hypothetical protein